MAHGKPTVAPYLRRSWLQNREVPAKHEGRQLCLPDGEAEANAALIVAAVNSFDESRALLKEAADMIEHHTISMRARHLSDHKQQDLIARIRVFLETTK